MRDIALKAAVSKATVSLALRADARIPEQTRTRIQHIADQLGYAPDPLLSALSARRRQQRATANIAVVIDERWGEANSHPQWLRNIRTGIDASARALGYSHSFFSLQKDLATHRTPDRMLASRGIRGLILMPFYTDQPRLPNIDWSLYSVVAIGDPLPDLGCHRIGTDAFIAMNLACKKLREHGFSRIALAQHLDTGCRLRHEWLGSLLKEYYLHNDSRPQAEPFLYTQPDAKAFLKWYQKMRPEVILSNDDSVIDWLQSTDIRIPADVSIALLNCDSSAHAHATGVIQHIAELGNAAIQFLHTLILCGERGAPAVRRELLIAPGWREGNTLRAPASHARA